jgi:kynureninase
MHTLATAQQLDNKDILKNYRNLFHIPIQQNKEIIYFCGNSLGLQPITVKKAITEELDQWAKYAVEGHFIGEKAWKGYHHLLSHIAAKLVGAKTHEVVIMNSLTVNLHLLMISFYQPTKKRYKILMEGGAFPSDQYAAESQVRFHGFEPKDAIIELLPREGETTLQTSDILEQIAIHGEELALILLGGVNYYTGQCFDMQTITAAGHKTGAKVGFDLAHAAGNVLLNLHDWQVDFAVWCTYKYLNSGPGGTSGVFIHEKYANDNTLPRLAGWWGHDEESRFLMQKGFKPMYGAAGWQLSNAQILPMAVHLASLKIFEEAGMENLRQKSEKLTAFAEQLIRQYNNNQNTETHIQIITPTNPQERGCQLSLVFNKNGKAIHQKLLQHGVMADWREPDVIRIAPVPLYNTFTDIWNFYEILQQATQ